MADESKTIVWLRMKEIIKENEGNFTLKRVGELVELIDDLFYLGGSERRR